MRYALSLFLLVGLAQAEPYRPLVLTQSFDPNYPWLDPSTIAVKLEITDILDDEEHLIWHWQFTACAPGAWWMDYNEPGNIWWYWSHDGGLCDLGEFEYRCETPNLPWDEWTWWGFGWPTSVEPNDLPFCVGWYVFGITDSMDPGPAECHLVFDPTKSRSCYWDPNVDPQFGNPCGGPCSGAWFDSDECCPLLYVVVPEPIEYPFSTLTYYVGPTSEQWTRGDSACDDGRCGLSDIDFFVEAIPNDAAGWAAKHQAYYGHPPIYRCEFLLANDVNDDGYVNFGDVDAFVDCIAK